MEPVSITRLPPPPPKGEPTMATMTDSRRKKIQARQRKRENAEKRAAKIAKRERNAKKA
jgi:hypothetical protein